jgi:hypothetical protein
VSRFSHQPTGPSASTSIKLTSKLSSQPTDNTVVTVMMVMMIFAVVVMSVVILMIVMITTG